MEKLTITIEVTAEGKLSIHHDQPVTLEVLTQVYQTAQLAAMNQAVNKAQPKDQPAVQEAIYDMFNVAASNLLTQFAPHLELRPNLTTEAIKQQEDQILTKHWDTLSAEQQQKILKQKANLKPHKLGE